MCCIDVYFTPPAAVHVVNFYFDDEREKERNNILQLVQKKDPSSDLLLQGYVREAMRECSDSLSDTLTDTYIRSRTSSMSMPHSCY